MVFFPPLPRATFGLEKKGVCWCHWYVIVPMYTSYPGYGRGTDLAHQQLLLLWEDNFLLSLASEDYFQGSPVTWSSVGKWPQLPEGPRNLGMGKWSVYFPSLQVVSETYKWRKVNVYWYGSPRNLPLWGVRGHCACILGSTNPISAETSGWGATSFHRAVVRH